MTTTSPMTTGARLKRLVPVLGTVIAAGVLVAACSSAPVTPAGAGKGGGTATGPGEAGSSTPAFCHGMYQISTTLAPVPTLPTTSPPSSATLATYTTALNATASLAQSAASVAPDATTAAALTKLSTDVHALVQSPSTITAMFGTVTTPADFDSIAKLAQPVATDFSTIWATTTKDCPAITGAPPSILPNVATPTTPPVTAAVTPNGTAPTTTTTPGTPPPATTPH